VCVYVCMCVCVYVYREFDERKEDLWNVNFTMEWVLTCNM